MEEERKKNSVFYPQSTKGWDPYALSGGGLSDGGRLSQAIPTLLERTLPEEKKGAKSENQLIHMNMEIHQE